MNDYVDPRKSRPAIPFWAIVREFLLLFLPATLVLALLLALAMILLSAYRPTMTFPVPGIDGYPDARLLLGVVVLVLAVASGYLGYVRATRKQWLTALADSQRKLAAIFDQTSQFIILISPNGVLLEANRSALELVGIRAEEVIGKLVWETPWWSHSAALQGKLRNAVDRAARGEVARFEASHPASDGSLHFMDCSLKPVKNDHGDIVYLILEGRDITERKQAEKTLEEEEGDEAALEVETPIFFGRFLVHNGLVSEHDLEAALAVQHDLNDCTLCAAVEQGLITLKDVIKCRTYQREKLVTLEEALVALGVLTSDEVGRLKTFLAQNNIPVGDLLVKRGVLTTKELEKALSTYQKARSLFVVEL